MRKTLTAILLVAAIAVAMPTSAQVRFGLQGGLNLTNASLKDIEGSIKSRTGFFIGPMVKFTLPVVGLGVDAAALYDQREAKSQDGSATLKSQSIQIPINLRYAFGLGSLAEVFLFAGPQFGFNIGSKDKTLEEQANIARTTWTLATSALSANLGVGATVLNHLQLKLNYNFALGKTGEFKFTDLQRNYEQTKGNAKLSAWQISAAYLF